MCDIVCVHSELFILVVVSNRLNGFFLFEVAGVYASKEDTCIFRGTIANVGILILTVTINSNPHLTITLTGNHGSTIAA